MGIPHSWLLCEVSRLPAFGGKRHEHTDGGATAHYAKGERSERHFA